VTPLRVDLPRDERDIYIQQMLLLFRRHGLSGSLDNLD
jgi:hypothetical protein